MRRSSSHGAAAAALLLAALLCAEAPAAVQARIYSYGDIVTPYQKNLAGASLNTKLTISPSSASAMPTGCAASTNTDFAARRNLSEWDPPTWTPTTTLSAIRGPYLRQFYPAVNATQVPNNCNPTAWSWERLRRLIEMTHQMGLNYCHHRCPSYDAPASTRIACTGAATDDPNCVCAATGLTKPKPWQGLDCSNYAAWLLNIGFGFYPSTDVGEQACHPERAPGRLLHNISLPENSTSLLPGDLLFITPSRSSNTAPVRVSHVAVFTGYKVDFVNKTSPFYNTTLLANLPASQHKLYTLCFSKEIAAKRPVFVISDSSQSGPAYRPLCSWYMTAFSHARRVIDPNVAAFPRTNDATIAYWNATDTECYSLWKLSKPA